MAEMPHIDIRKMDNATITVTVRVTQEFRVRMWLATKLIAIASRVLGAQVVVNIEPSDD